MRSKACYPSPSAAPRGRQAATQSAAPVSHGPSTHDSRVEERLLGCNAEQMFDVGQRLGDHRTNQAFLKVRCVVRL